MSGKLFLVALFVLFAGLLWVDDISGHGVATLTLQPRYERTLIMEK
jgi:hypothetical protein